MTRNHFKVGSKNPYVWIVKSGLKNKDIWKELKQLNGVILD